MWGFRAIEGWLACWIKFFVSSENWTLNIPLLKYETTNFFHRAPFSLQIHIRAVGFALPHMFCTPGALYSYKYCTRIWSWSKWPATSMSQQSSNRWSPALQTAGEGNEPFFILSGLTYWTSSCSQEERHRGRLDVSRPSCLPQVCQTKDERAAGLAGGIAFVWDEKACGRSTSRHIRSRDSQWKGLENV